MGREENSIEEEQEINTEKEESNCMGGEKESNIEKSNCMRSGTENSIQNGEETTKEKKKIIE